MEVKYESIFSTKINESSIISRRFKNRFSLKNKIDPKRQLTTPLFIHSLFSFDDSQYFRNKNTLKYSEKTIIMFLFTYLKVMKRFKCKNETKTFVFKIKPFVKRLANLLKVLFK